MSSLSVPFICVFAPLEQSTSLKECVYKSTAIYGEQTASSLAK